MRAVGSARILTFLGSIIALVAFAVASAVAHEASLQGLVLATLPRNGEVVVRHGALFGRVAAVSTFRVEPASALRELKPGESIVATADGDRTPWTLAHIHVVGTEALTGAPPPETSGTHIFRDVHHVVVGEYAPLPALVDQQGKPFSLRDLRGQSVVMAFIYTRCRDARECPLTTSRFAALQAKFRGAPVHLVLVTLDPVHDRPSVLASYGRAFGSDAARWTLATGEPDNVLNFAAQFDVTAFPDERIGLIHPERTVILDKYGAIRELIDEGAWTPDEIVASVRHDERLASNPFERLDLWLSSAAVSVCGNAVAGFSGFTDLLVVIAIATFFTLLLWRVGLGIARGAA